MKSVSAPLLALLNSSQQYILADLYTITLIGGAVLHYAAFDADLTFSSVTYSSSGPGFKRSNSKTVIGVEVDTLDVEIYPNASTTINGIGMLAAAVAGAFDQATLKLDRAFITLSNGIPTVVGTLNVFMGHYADLQVFRNGIKLRVNSMVSMLNIQMPRNMYQAQCLHTLYDNDCGVVRSAYAVNSTAGAGSTASSIACSLSQAAGYFTRGYLVFTSGALSGVKRTVKGWAPGLASVFNPLPAAPAVGDAFTIYPGCNRIGLGGDCESKFSNLGRFRGCPYIPPPPSAI